MKSQLKYKNRFNKTLGTLFLLSSGVASLDLAAQTNQVISNKHQQMIMVVSDNWQASSGLLYRYEKVAGQWQKKAKAVEVTLGRTGLAWGLGLHPEQVGQSKKEGDGKAPAGIFTLGDAFGYLPRVKTGLNYQRMSASDYCIDVNGSPYYNQVISKFTLGDQAIKGSSEPMRRDLHLNGDQVYKKGFVIEHNLANKSGAGSCIFAHIWRAPDKATAGCTAMDEDNIDTVLTWLETSKAPVYVALPKEEYLKKKIAWQLPEL